jgi:hypothetical protein
VWVILASAGENEALRARVALATAVVVLLSASALLAASVSSEWFTPLFMLRSKALPGAKWLVTLAEVSSVVLIGRNHLGWGSSLALMFATANVLALPFNFFGAWLGSRWEARTDWMALRFWWFYVFQMLLVVVAWVAARQLPANERRYGQAALVAGAWAMLFFVLGGLTMPPAVRP